ncbi:MAG: AsmA-like C-terminal region-containing protein, partial [Pseudomonadota bacterium]
GETETTDLNIRVENARLRNAPFLTQILSLASLRGLADTLGGDGVLFSRIDLPLRSRAGRYVVQGGRASGPAMGLTVNGWVEPDAGGIAIDGVLVPSYGMNSALGGIPIIGDLFVSREGEGVFSLTYSVRGELERAQVAVNPLSAITPGVLRRIFENPTQTDLPLPDEIPAGE